MKTFVLHISDIHFADQHQMEQKHINAIIKTIENPSEIRLFLICITGDVASKGLAEEYRLANNFINNLVQGIKISYDNLFPLVYVIPGNHDYRLEGHYKDRTDIDVKEIIERFPDVDILKNELSNMEPFFQFSSLHNCFEEERLVEPHTFYVHDKNAEKVVLRINLVNSTLFSILNGNSKGIHFLPDYEIQKTGESNADITITMLHHSPEWFTYSGQLAFEEAIRETTTLLLYGHEHYSENYAISKEKGYIISKGGMLSNINNFRQSEFNTVLIDTKSKNLTLKSHQWNNAQHFYSNNSTETYSFETKKSNENHIEVDRNFYHELRRDAYNNDVDSFLDYFIFPTLQQFGESEIKKNISIDNIKDFSEIIEKKQTVIITGKDTFGKTTLAKYLFLHHFDETAQTPIYIEGSDLPSKDNKKILKRVFQDQYDDDPIYYEKYMQLPKANRIVIIDDSHLIEKQSLDRLLEQLYKDCSTVILISSHEEEYDINEQVKRLTLQADAISFKIEPFYKSKRKELIEKALKTQLITQEASINSIFNQVEFLFSQDITYSNRTPYFIVQYITYLRSSTKDTETGAATFTKVYEINLLNNLRSMFSDNEVDEVLRVLERLAFETHKNKTTVLSYDRFFEIVKQYNDEYGMSVDATSLRDKLKNTKVIKELFAEKPSIKFSDNTILAYLISEYLVREWGSDGDFANIKNVIKYIAFGINSDILLFISYTLKNKRLLLMILGEFESLTHNWQKICFEDNQEGNIEYIMTYKEPGKISAPTIEDRKGIEVRQDLQEKEVEELNEIVTISDFEYCEEDLGIYINELKKALVLSKMIAQILPSFYADLDKTEKMKFVEAVYSSPDKISFRLLKPLDDNFDAFMNSIFESIQQNEGITLKDKDKDKLMATYKDISIASILGYYDTIITHALSERTLDILVENYDSENINDELQKLLAQGVIGDLDVFSKNAISINRKATHLIVNNMIKRIVWATMLRNDVPQPTQERLINEFFRGGRKTFYAQKAKKLKEYNESIN